jgi:hypothetical protein
VDKDYRITLLWILATCQGNEYTYCSSSFGDPENERYFTFINFDSPMIIYKLNFQGVWKAWTLSKEIGPLSSEGYDFLFTYGKLEHV